MPVARRGFLNLAALSVALPAFARQSRAESYPARPVHIVAGYPPGAAPDIIARLIGQALSDRLGQQFVVDNRPGAASNIGSELVAHATPDGYTLLMTVSTNAVNATLYNNLNFDFIHDLVPVAGICSTPFLISVTNSFPANTVPELIAYAKANPDKINFATHGVGTGPHVAGELFKMMTGITLVHVPYKGSYANDLISGQVQLTFTPIAENIEFVRSGKLRALAVTTAKRSAALPDVPAIGEFVPGYVAAGWYGLCAPRGTSNDIIATLAKATLASDADPTLKSRLATLGVEPMPLDTAAFGKFITSETEKWAKVIQFSGVKPE
jgi:tripartite-type tricarboxylate transporter receptor subunit TctC